MLNVKYINTQCILQTFLQLRYAKTPASPLARLKALYLWTSSGRSVHHMLSKSSKLRSRDNRWYEYVYTRNIRLYNYQLLSCNMPLFANKVERSEYFHRCIDLEDWKEIPVAQPEFLDSDQFCHKKIHFARPHSNREDLHIKCCITNVAGTDCSDQTHLQMSESKP